MKKSQSGRSMVEIMAVLAVIGLLSIGGIAGYATAMMKYKVNEVLSGIRERALAISEYQGLQDKVAEDLLQYQDKPLKGFEVSLYHQKIEGTDFAIQIKNVNQKLCEQIASQGLESAILVRPDLCDFRDDNTLIFAFNNDLNGKTNRRGKPGELSDDQSRRESEVCEVKQEGDLRCQSNISEKCQKNVSGRFYWTQREECLYGCSGGVCSSRDCTGNAQKCWDERLLLTCSDGKWQRDVTCASTCSNNQCGEDCPQSYSTMPEKVACWGKGNFSEPAEVYACQLDSNNRYTYSHLVDTCTDKSCDECMSEYIATLQ